MSNHYSSEPVRFGHHVRGQFSKTSRKSTRFQFATARGREETAWKQFRPTTVGVQCSRPLERIEIDEREPDLWTIIDANDWKDKLSEEDIARLGLRKGKGRPLDDACDLLHHQGYRRPYDLAISDRPSHAAGQGEGPDQ